MFRLETTKIPGCYEIFPAATRDERGEFVKVFHDAAFRELGLETGFVESYYSVSGKNVLRGMHFQRPPMDHAKLVYCIEGAVLDVAVDLRKGSPAYGTCAKFELDARRASLVYLPRGMAHGFLVKSDRATLVYSVTSVYSPQHDDGIHWNSVSVSWPIASPIVSSRDRGFQALADWKSPFDYVG